MTAPLDVVTGVADAVEAVAEAVGSPEDRRRREVARLAGAIAVAELRPETPARARRLAKMRARLAALSAGDL